MSVAEDHAQMVRKLFKVMPDFAQTLMHAAAGCAGEGGEFLDVAKKVWAYQKPFDADMMAHAVEELGDLEFYLRAAYQTLGLERDHVLAANMAKLGQRYPSGIYSNEQAIRRADKVRIGEDQ